MEAEIMACLSLTPLSPLSNHQNSLHKNPTLLTCNTSHPTQINCLIARELQRPDMEIESARCECCGLKEDCTPHYISEVKARFEGKWLCGLCAEAVRDEVSRNGKKKVFGVEEAVKSHMSFCRKFKSNPAVQVADGMRQMLRRRSGDSPSSSASKKFMRSTST